MVKRVAIPDTIKCRRLKRVEVPCYTYDWHGAYEQWARGFVARNFWRVRFLFGSEEDALQECAAIFIQCHNKYRYNVDTPQWMMALFKTSVSRMWCTFAIEDKKRREAVPEEIDVPYDFNRSLLDALSGASDELKDLAYAILASPSEMLSLIFNGEDSKVINRRIRRLFGISGEQRDYVAELRSVLSPVE